jgi:hypothetical protein
MNTLLLMTIDTTQIQNDVAFRSSFGQLPNYEYSSGTWWIKTDHSPTEFRRIVAPNAGTAPVTILRIPAATLKDAVLDNETRAWVTKQFPGVALTTTAAA